MSKDPSFLFYSSDFLTGTMLMTNEQVGKYIRLICLQHQKGHLSEKDMLNICNSHDEDIWLKFVQDKQGKYYNVRCEEEINRRRKYSQSRSNNRKSGSKNKKDMKNISKSYVKHMENENENENINILNKEKESKFLKPKFEDVKKYCFDRNKGVDPDKFWNYYEANGWKIGKNPMKNWQAAVRTWEKNSDTQEVKTTFKTGNLL